MVVCGSLEFVTEMANLLMQAGRRSGVLGRLDHKRQNLGEGKGKVVDWMRIQRLQC
jgi:hypothetical protein